MPMIGKQPALTKEHLMLNLHKNREHGHPPHGHHGHPLHPVHDRHGHPPHPGHSHQGAAATLEKVVLPQDVIWLTRAMRVCPPEMRALFRLHIAMIEHQLMLFEAISTSPPQFDLSDLVKSDASRHSLSITLLDSEQQGCLHDLMLGPEEVNAVAFVSLVSLRLADLLSTQAVTEGGEIDG